MEYLKVLISRKERNAMIDTALCDKRVCKFSLAPGPQYLGAR